MRDIKRISIILKKLEEIWIKNPDLRLGQLILNLTGDCVEIYMMENEELIMGLGELYASRSD